MTAAEIASTFGLRHEEAEHIAARFAGLPNGRVDAGVSILKAAIISGASFDTLWRSFQLLTDGPLRLDEINT